MDSHSLNTSILKDVNHILFVYISVSCIGLMSDDFSEQSFAIFNGFILHCLYFYHPSAHSGVWLKKFNFTFSEIK